MKKNRWSVVILCSLLAVAILLALPFLNKDGDGKKSPAGTLEDPTPDTESEQKQTAEPAPIPDGLSSRVEITPEKEGEALSFPCTLEGYGLVLEKLAPYDGIFLEDGTGRKVSRVAMLQVKNGGSLPVEYCELGLSFAGEELLFSLSALPAGATVLVQEKTGKALPDSPPLGAVATVIPRDRLELSEDRVKVKDNGDGSLTVTNLTGEDLSEVRIFYKYCKEGVYLGGIAFSLRVNGLSAKKSVTLKPAHFTSGECRVVMVQIEN